MVTPVRATLDDAGTLTVFVSVDELLQDQRELVPQVKELVNQYMPRRLKLRAIDDEGESN